jgi:hypothetical protein
MLGVAFFSDGYPMQSKNSCSLTVIIDEQSTQPLVTFDADVDDVNFGYFMGG